MIPVVDPQIEVQPNATNADVLVCDFLAPALIGSANFKAQYLTTPLRRPGTATVIGLLMAT